MDFMAQMKAEMERKRKKIASVEVESNGIKFFKRGELNAKEDEKYYAKQKKRREERSEEEAQASSSGSSKDKNKPSSEESDSSVEKLTLPDVRRRLRARNLPILLFGETEKESRARLLKHEIEQPDIADGLKNEMQKAMQDVDNELVKEVIEGTTNDAGKHDVDLPEHFSYNWEKIEQRATLLGLGDDGGRDCDIILEFFKYILARWGMSLNQREDDVKKSAHGKHEASIHKQTVMHLKPLLNSLESHNCNYDIRHHLAKICRLLILDRNYILANNAYMEMAIGNAPWPVGVTRSGIHQRPGSAKSYVSNIAHVLNDETQRKYIQAFKRMMTKMQEYFPTDPSKCVEFVKS